MAIKVNGTNVITDSRALNNITGADAATVAALGNAGVGGNTANLGETSLSGTPTAFDISLDSGYDKHVIYIYGMGTNDYSAGIALQMSNSSGSMLSNDHYWQADINSYGDEGQNQGLIKIHGNQIYTQTNGTFYFEVINARDSSKKTIGRWRAHFENGYSSMGGWVMNTAQVNTTIRVKKWSTSAYTLRFGSGAYYKKYAVK